MERPRKKIKISAGDVTDSLDYHGEEEDRFKVRDCLGDDHNVEKYCLISSV
jgi:hypothetical protein